MTLTQRIALAIAILTIATTALLGFGVREAWRRAEDERFREQGIAAFQRAQTAIQSQTRELPDLIGPLCAHDPVVDSALVGLKSGDLDSRRLSLSLRVPELQKALRLDELLLITSGGEILGAGHDEGLTGTRDRNRAKMMDGEGRLARLRTSAPMAVETWCLRRDKSRQNLWVGLYAARRVDTTLSSVAEAHDLSLTLTPPATTSDEMVFAMPLGELGVTLHAARSRVPLTSALQRLDTTIAALGAGTLIVALALSFLLSRGLARPIVSLAKQARGISRQDPKPVRASGGRELRELANAFNQAIEDLAAMRKRLAATERIAARREIARRVAHEIKNPLAPIRAAVETLRRLRARNDPAFDEYFDEATRTVLDEVTRITNIVSEFTRFARLPPPNPAPMDIGAAVKRVVGLHDSEAVPIELKLQPVPQINADNDQMIQVLTNLIQNALDAARESAEPRVWVSLSPREKQQVELSVRDNGPGVSAEMRDKLFEPYATNKPQGTGLGLAIVQRIVFEHGGEIRHDTPSQGGAAFHILLPVNGPTLLTEAPPSVTGT
ncbi:MAG: ATP-binding protein [Polyangiaceae bacterium]